MTHQRRARRPAPPGEKEWVGRLSLAATLLPVRKLRYKKNCVTKSFPQ